MQSSLLNPETPDETLWQNVAPLLDEALENLNETDRRAVLLRFFEQQSLAQIGAALALNEEAARKRVARALEKLRKFFLKRGVTLTAVTLGTAMTANSVHAAPAGLTISAAAAAKGSAVAASTLTLAKGALKIMAWTKMSTTLAVVAAVVLTTTVSVVVLHHDRLIQGKTESAWIKSIVYNGGSEQTTRWLSLGPEGVRMLTRALLAPANDRVTRMSVADLLCSEIAATSISRSDATRYHAVDPLANWEDYAKHTLPPKLLRCLQTETDDGVRGCVLACFETMLPEMTEKEKAPFFPEFLRCLPSKDANVRNNALVALRYYPGQARVMTPALVEALQDSEVRVRLRAADALAQVDARTGIQAGIIPILIDILKNPDDQIAWQAPGILGAMGPEAASAVPDLISSARGTNRLVAHAAASALRRIDPAAAAQAGVK